MLDMLTEAEGSLEDDASVVDREFWRGTHDDDFWFVTAQFKGAGSEPGLPRCSLSGYRG